MARARTAVQPKNLDSEAPAGRSWIAVAWELERLLKPRPGRGRKRAAPEVKLRGECGSKIRRQMDSVTRTSERIGPRWESQPGVEVLTGR